MYLLCLDFLEGIRNHAKQLFVTGRTGKDVPKPTGRGAIQTIGETADHISRTCQIETNKLQL